VPIDNWNADEDQYSFLYVPEHTSEPALLVRALVAGDLLLASVLPGTATAEPVTVELAVERFAGPDASSYSYQELGALLGSLRAALPQASAHMGTWHVQLDTSSILLLKVLLRVRGADGCKEVHGCRSGMGVWHCVAWHALSMQVTAS
jgi:hypothetical protein